MTLEERRRRRFSEEFRREQLGMYSAIPGIRNSEISNMILMQFSSLNKSMKTREVILQMEPWSETTSEGGKRATTFH